MANKNVPKKGTRKIRRKGKKWFSIIAPKMFNNLKIGETMAYEPSQLVGRKLRVNLMTLMNDSRKQNVNINFIIDSINGENGVCKVVGYELNKAHLKRLVKKGISKIEDSFLAESKDGVKFKIKPLLITRFKLKNSVATEMRKRLKEKVKNSFKQTNWEEIIISIVQNRLQRDLKGVLKKVYPLSYFEVRVLELV